MSKTKIAVILSLALIAGGALTCGFAFTAMGFDARKLNTGTYAEKSYDVTDDFQDIRIHCSMDRIRFVPSEDGSCHVELYDHEKVDLAVSVDSDALDIRTEDNSKWFEHIGFFTMMPTMTVCLPKDHYRSLLINTSTGDVEFSSLAFDGDIELHTHTGATKIEDVTCDRLTSEGNTGDIKLENVLIAGSLNVSRNTGDIEFNDCDAASCTIETNTGDVEGTFLTEKTFTVKTATGDVDVPNTTGGGSCMVTTATGDIEIRIR